MTSRFNSGSGCLLVCPLYLQLDFLQFNRSHTISNYVISLMIFSQAHGYMINFQLQPAKKQKKDVSINSRLYDLGLNHMLCNIDIIDYMSACGYTLKGCVD